MLTTTGDEISCRCVRCTFEVNSDKNRQVGGERGERYVIQGFRGANQLLHKVVKTHLIYGSGATARSYIHRNNVQRTAYSRVHQGRDSCGKTNERRLHIQEGVASWQHPLHVVEIRSADAKTRGCWWRTFEDRRGTPTYLPSPISDGRARVDGASQRDESSGRRLTKGPLT